MKTGDEHGVRWEKNSCPVEARSEAIRESPMLGYLRLRMSALPLMEMELAPRLNLITGDNGLGKSFLLDVAWWR